ncbi:MAG: hypothetical protein ACYCYK_08155 [Candidatus Dormibacteria bacterium]
MARRAKFATFSRVSPDLAPAAVAFAAGLVAVAAATVLTMPSVVSASAAEGLRAD